MKKQLKHVAWDFGIVLDTVSEILGYSPKQKTTKTLCKRRIILKNIDNKNPTCPICSERLKRDPVYGESKG